MDIFIGFKMLKAVPMTAKEAGNILQRPIDNSNADPEGNGYLVQYEDGYTSWSPKQQFDAAHLRVIPGEHGLPFSAEMVEKFIESYAPIQVGDNTIMVAAKLINGYEVIETFNFADKAYNAEVGFKICQGKIMDRVFLMLDFLIRTAVNGIKREEPATEEVQQEVAPLPSPDRVIRTPSEEEIIRMIKANAERNKGYADEIKDRARRNSYLAMPMKGDKVHYVLRKGKHRPATILEVLDDGKCSLRVEHKSGRFIYINSAEYNVEGYPETWHFIENLTSNIQEVFKDGK